MTGQDNNSLQKTKAWRRLAEHRQQVVGLRLREEFIRDLWRARRFSLGLEGIFVDFSKT